MLARVSALAREAGLAVVHAYATNPLPEQVAALLAAQPPASSPAPLTFRCAAAAPFPADAWTPPRPREVEWLVPPGEEPMQ